MNKKLTKVLSIFLIAGIIGTGSAVGLAGCGKKQDENQGNTQTEYKVIFNMKGHGAQIAEAATSGGKVTKPADPTDSGYDFGGWYTDEACTQGFDFSSAVSADITLYAKWTAKVVPPPAPVVTGVTLSSLTEGVQIEEGKIEITTATASVTLKATVEGTNNPSAEVTWSVEGEGATVADGVVTITAAGKVTVTATSKADATKKASVEITVTPHVVAVEGVALNKAQTTLVLGGEQGADVETLVATVSPELATDKSVSWTSSNAEVATVDGNGKVTAKGAGTARITVTTTDGSHTAECVVTVVRKAAGVALDKSELALTVNDEEKKEATLVATVSPSDTTDKTVSWSSSAESVATVDNNGKVTAVATGTAVITVTTADGGHTATCTVSVTKKVTGVALDKSELALIVNDEEKKEATLVATVSPEDASNKAVSWTTSDAAVATVENGKVTAKGAGTATITVTTADGGHTATCAVTVTKKVTGVALDKSELALIVNDEEKKEATLVATVSPEDASNKAVSWTTSDAAVATVENGKVTAKGAGTATITVTTADGGHTATCAVTVTKKVTGVALDKSELALIVNDEEKKEATLVATVSPEDASNKAVSWTTSDAAVATVENGKVTAKGAGTATITVTTADGGHTATCAVTVTKKVTGVTLSAESKVVENGDTFKLTAAVTPADATNQAVSWTTSDDKVVTVDQSGNVEAVGVGTATITVTTADGSFTAECGVTVNAKVIRVTGVSLDKIALNLEEEQSDKLVATVAPAGASNKNITWTSSDDTVATVAGGLVSALKAGTATITATTEDGSFTATCEVKVVKKVIHVSEITITKSSASLEVGEYETLVCQILPADADNTAVTWSSSDAAVAKVDNSGKVTAMAVGTAVITVTSVDGNKSAICTVTVKEVGADAVHVTGVTLDKTTATIEVEEHLNLNATIAPVDADDTAVTWSSSDDKVATVSEGGVITGVGVGTAVITVTTHDGSFTATCKVTVNAKTVPVSGVVLDKASATMEVEDELTLVATVAPTGATNKAVTWSSSDDKVATVDEDGKVVATGVGSATITVTTTDGSFTATCELTVNAKTVNVTGVTLDVTSATVDLGDDVTLKATVAPADATNKKIIWTTSDDTVATVAGGVLTLLKVGDVTITATTEDGSFTATCKLKVVVKVTGVALDKEELTVELGGEDGVLTATVTPENATNKNVVWSTSDDKIATVDQSGKITAVKTGTVTITVTTEDGNKSASCEVTVIRRAASVSLDRTSATLELDGAAGKDKLALTATVAPEDTTDKSVTWSSSDDAVATVDEDGNVTAHKAGTATITVKTADGGFTATCEVTVEQRATGVTLDKTSATLALNVDGEKTVELEATVGPEDATNKDVSWTTSDGTVATVDEDGKVTAIGEGTATITVTTADGGFIATCEVTVKKKVLSVTVAGDAYMYVGSEQTLTATVTPEDATNNTVTWDSSDEAVATVDGNGKVTALKSGTVSITATADGVSSAAFKITTETVYEKMSKQDDVLLAEDFSTTATAGVTKHGGYGTKGVYVSDDTEGAFEVKDGALIAGDGIASGKTGNVAANVSVIIDFGKIKNEVEGYFELTMTADSKNDFNSFTFMNGSTKALVIMANGTNGFTAKLNGNAVTPANAVKVAKDTLYRVYYKFDLANKKVWLTINGVALFDNYDSNISMLTGVDIITSNDGQRQNVIDNIIVCGSAYTADDHRAGTLAKIEAEIAKYPTVSVPEDATDPNNVIPAVVATHSYNKAAIDGLAENYAAAVAAAATIEALDQLVEDVKVALAAIESDTVVDGLRADAIAELEAYDGGSANFTDNASEYAAAINAAKAVINSATRASTIAAALEEGKVNVLAINSQKDIAKLELLSHKNAADATIDGVEASVMDADRKAAVKEQIASKLADGYIAIDAAADQAGIDAALAVAKGNITTIVNANTSNFDSVKDDVLDTCDGYFDAYLTTYNSTDYAELNASLAAAKTTWHNAINAITEEGDGVKDGATLLTEKLDEAKAAADALVLPTLKTDSKAEITAYATTKKADILSNEYKTLIDGVVTSASADIDEAETNAAVGGLVTKAKKDIDDLVADLAEHKFTVSFVDSDGSTAVRGVSAQQVTYLESATLPTAPRKDGYKFIKWTIKVGEEYVDYAFTEDVVDNIKLIANWREHDVTIRYIVDGNVQATRTAAYDDEVDIDYTVPVYKSGLLFEKWCATAELTSDFEAPDEYTQNGVVSLYAKFSGYKPDSAYADVNWLVSASDTALPNTSLFEVSSADEYVRPTATDKTGTLPKVNGVQVVTEPDGTINALQHKGGFAKDTSASITFLAKEDIKLTVYIALADQAWNGNRTGTISWTGCADSEIKNVTDKTVYEITATVRAGEKFVITGNNTHKNVARLWLFGAKATMADDFGNVTVNYHYADNDVRTQKYFTVRDKDKEVDDITLPTAVPEKTDHVFLGWNTDSEATTAMTEAQLKAAVKVMLGTAGEYDIYPVFFEKDVIINWHNGAQPTVTKYCTIDEEEIVIEADAVSGDGYAFLGWAATENAAVGAILTESAIKAYKEMAGTYNLYPVFAVPDVTVTYHYGEEDTVEQQYATTNPADTFKLPTRANPVNGDYMFLGWNTSSTATVAMTGAQLQTMIETAGEYDLYPIFATPNVTITYHYGESDTEQQQYISTYHTEVVLPTRANPTKTNARFLGWNTDDEATAAFTATQLNALLVAGTYNLYPVFLDADVTINYYVPAEVEGVLTMPDTPTNTAKAFSDEDAVAPTAPTLTGYRFMGWYESSACTGDEYEFDGYEEDETVNLYAKFAKEYTVTFNYNNGSAAGVERYITGEQVSKPDDPEKEGYNFGGWYTDEDLENEATWTDGKITVGTGNITLYAKWNEQSSTRYFIVSGNKNNASLANKNTDLEVKYNNGTSDVTAFKIRLDVKGIIARDHSETLGTQTVSQVMVASGGAVGDHKWTFTAGDKAVDLVVYAACSDSWGDPKAGATISGAEMDDIETTTAYSRIEISLAANASYTLTITTTSNNKYSAIGMVEYTVK